MQRKAVSGLVVMTLATAGWAWHAAADPTTAPTTAPAVTAPAATRPAEGPSPTTGPASAEAVALAAKLSSPDWQARAAAEKALVRLGDEAVPALEEVAKSATLDEARTAAVNALKLIAENRQVGPTYVSLHLKDVPPRKAYEALAKAAKIPLKAYDETIWKELPDAKVTLDLDHQPLWEAIRQLSKQTGLQLGNYDGKWVLIPADGILESSRYALSGPFIVAATQMQRTQTVDLTQPNAPSDENFSIAFTAIAEPKVKVLGASSMMKLEQVVDENGNSLIPPNADAIYEHYISPVFGDDSSFPFMAWLKYPSKNPGQKIALFRGTVEFHVQVESQTLDVPISALKTTTRNFKGVQLTFGDLTKVGEKWQLKIVAATSEDTAVWEELQNSVMGYLKVVDAKGQALEHHGFGSSQGPASVELTATYGASQSDEGRPSGAPARIIWEIPTRTKTLSIPVELKDLKLP